ncbi:hypothetical protein OH738_23300 [Streptomyces hirsutus]|uniref:glycogen debranching N-terminal domain-containing protein n=1 Tax=Streptomyces hirsutus TaxID=35620 RepID=UPI00386BADD3|nr:hypothetical protein OH738_23300 [Streptomyces hirsutus]
MDHPTANAPAAASASEGLLPFLHDAVLTLCAPSLAISRADGQLDGGAAGFYHGDRRASAQLTVATEGITLAPVDGGLRGANRAEFRSLLRGLDEVAVDPALALHRRRTVTAVRHRDRPSRLDRGRLSRRRRITGRGPTDSVDGIRRPPARTLRRPRQGGGPVPSPLPGVLPTPGVGSRSSVLVLRSVLGLDADVPAGTVTVAPTFAGRHAPLTVTGLQVGGGRLDVTLTADGSVEVTAPEGLAVVTT